MRILEIKQYKELEKLMHAIKVDPYGIKIMVPKALTYIIKLNSVSHVAANILKQEMLSLGADAAIAKDAISGKVKKTDCLLIASLAQFRSLHGKLAFQPFGLAELAQDISAALNNYQKTSFTLNLGKHAINLSSQHTSIMGVVNLTPDSFSTDGLYSNNSTPKEIKTIIAHVERLVREGADIIDIGGESTRPGAKPVSLKEELARTIPIIKLLAKKINVPISIDTYKPDVAKRALECGASLVNDISGLKDPIMAKTVSRYKAGVVIMHIKGRPATMQHNPHYVSLLEEIIEYLRRRIDFALSYGILRDQIIIDPGIGFGKTLEHNLEILNQLKEFKILGQPILVGVSRKSFIGKILKTGPQERLAGTLASGVLAAQNGANILRVHDVKAVQQALKIADKINNL